MLQLLTLLVLTGITAIAQQSTLPERDPALSGRWSAQFGDRPVVLELSATPSELLAVQLDFPKEHLFGLPLYRCQRRGDSIFAESRAENIRIEGAFSRADSTLDILMVRDRIPYAATFTRTPFPSAPSPVHTSTTASTPSRQEPTTTVLRIPDRERGAMRVINITSPVTAAPTHYAVIFADGHLTALRPLLDSLVNAGITVIWSDTLTARYAKAALRTLPTAPITLIGMGLGMEETARFDECDTTIRRVYLWYGHDPNDAGGRVQAQTYAARSCTGRPLPTTVWFESTDWVKALAWIRSGEPRTEN
jgi:hypothetical protein